MCVWYGRNTATNSQFWRYFYLILCVSISNSNVFILKDYEY